MSNEALTWAFQQSLSVTDGKFVLVALADFADEAGSCFPGQLRLAEMTGQSERTVRRQVKNLEANDYVRRVPRFDRPGHRTSDRYFLNLSRDAATGQDDRRSTNARPPVKHVDTSSQVGRVSISEIPKKDPSDSDVGEVRSSKDGASEGAAEMDAVFEEFWAVCRKRVDRKRVRAAWDRTVKRGAEPAALISAMAGYTKATATRPAKYVKQPLTWLRGENWLDPEHTHSNTSSGSLDTLLGVSDQAWTDPHMQQF